MLYIESGDSDTVPVSGSDTLMVTISGLMYTTTYSIQVAAVNSIGTGVYSTSKIEQTAGRDLICRFCMFNNNCTL